MEPFDSLRSLRAFSLSVARHERTWRFAGGEAPGESTGGGGGSRNGGAHSGGRRHWTCVQSNAAPSLQ